MPSEQDKVSETAARYRRASKVIGCSVSSTDQFVAESMRWLSARFGDLHVEFHKEEGWQISTCYAEDQWGEDTWIRGDGTLRGCLCEAVLRTAISKGERSS